MADTATEKLPVVVLISGRGSNLHAIIDCVASGKLPIEIRAVISNRPDAAGLQYASAAGIATEILDHTTYTDRARFDQALQAAIDRHAPALVVLAGFMRILTDDFVARYAGRLMNIHPSLLPAFPGLQTHRHALAAGVRIHGCTVHFVTPALDGGPIIVQAAVPVQPGDSEETLAARVLREEHRIYPQAIRWFCEGRLALAANGKAVVQSARAPENVLVCPAVER